MAKGDKNIEPAVDNEPYLLEDLKDPVFAAEFLNAAIEEFIIDNDIKSFNAILGAIIKAGNVSKIARDSDMSRSQIYRMINGNCETSLLKTLKLLHAIGFQLKIEPIKS